MIVVLSGEGPSDLGCCTNGQGVCIAPDFSPGPMTIIVDKIIDEFLGYSILETTPHCYVYVSEKRLQELEQERKENRRRISLVGKKRDQETGYFYINSWMFGDAVADLLAQEGDGGVGILFRDSDGTRATAKGHWKAKVLSMKSGFDRSQIAGRGVPMIARPKSEAWLICAARPIPYDNCAELESRSGNDASPNSLKSEFSHLLNGQISTKDQVDWITSVDFDHAAVAEQMSSFGEFKNSLLVALAEA